MTDYIVYIFLAIIQGVTEFLPVSSSGHIEFSKHIIDNASIQNQGAFLTVILHLATALSIIFVFRKKIKELLFSNTIESRNYIFKISLSIIPVAFLVLFNIDERIDQKYDQGWDLHFISAMFMLTAVLLFFTEKINVNSKKITWVAALIIGIAQAVAVLPGISRSGATICCALLLGTSKKEASMFSFLICLPIIFGKSFKDAFQISSFSFSDFNFQILIAFVITFIIGLVCCKWMIKIVDQSRLKYFGIYCFLISISALIISLL